MEKPFLLVVTLVLLIQVPKIQSYCLEGREWHQCQNIQDAEKIATTIKYFSQSGNPINRLSMENCNMSVIRTTFFAQGYLDKITDLNITNSLVEHIEAGSFDHLTKLENLNIIGNNLNEFDGSVLENTTTLRRLTLQSNSIKSLTYMCSAKSLQEIFIEEPGLETINDDAFNGCFNIQRLSIINSGINSLKTNYTLHFTRLITLNLSGNRFEDFESFTENRIDSLDISNNQIKTLDAEIFRNIFTDLRTINLNNNLITHLVFSGQEPFANTVLQRMYLNSNQLAIINNVFFKYFSKLRILDIDNNPLENIAALSFKNLQMLEKLNIKNSLQNIRKLNVGIFDGLEYLQELDLSSASIISIDNYVFKDLKTLQKLNLENNSLTELRNGTFAGFKKLKQLNLKNNDITSIEAGAFFGLKSFETIPLKSFTSKIEHLKTRHFEGLSYHFLSVLDVSYLGVKTLEPRTFEGLFGLATLHLQGNPIEELGANIFVGVENLLHLNISSAQLTRIHKDAFTGLELKLRQLDLSNSKLEQLSPEVFEHLISLSLLDLSNNRFSTLGPWLFKNLHTLQYLHLHDNYVRNLAANTFDGLKSLKTLTFSSKYYHVEDIEAGALSSLRSLSSNFADFFSRVTTLKTDTFAGVESLHSLNFTNYKIQKIEAFAFRGLYDVFLLTLENNEISVLHKNAFSSLYEINTLNLRQNYLNEFTSDPFIETKIYNLILDENNFDTLDFNYLSEIPSLQVFSANNVSINTLIRSSKNITELKELYLRDNFIEFLNVSMFYGMNNLLKLDLSGNPITQIELSAFEQLHKLEYLYFSEMNIDDLTLSSLYGLTSLQNLSIINSSIKDLRNYAFVNTKLEQLVFIDTYIDTISPFAFDIETLTDLTFSNSNLHNLSYFNLSSLGNLRNLNLSSNNITSIECNQFKYLEQLRNLVLDNNFIDKVDVCAFTNLINLQNLDLSHNKLDHFSAGTFSNLNKLTGLNVSHNLMQNLNDFNLYPLTRIQDLDFNYNKLGDEALDAFNLQLNSAHKVGLNGNLFTCAKLLDTLQYFRKSNIYLLDYNLTFDKQNIDGIKCN